MHIGTGLFVYEQLFARPSLGLATYGGCCKVIVVQWWMRKAVAACLVPSKLVCSENHLKIQVKSKITRRLICKSSIVADSINRLLAIGSGNCRCRHKNIASCYSWYYYYYIIICAYRKRQSEWVSERVRSREREIGEKNNNNKIDRSPKVEFHHCFFVFCAIIFY